MNALVALGVAGAVVGSARTSMAQSGNWVRSDTASLSAPDSGSEAGGPADNWVRLAPLVAPDESEEVDVTPQPGFLISRPKPVAPLPIRLNQFVRSYVNGYLNAPGGLENSLARTKPYLPEMVGLLRKYGLPDDLVYLTIAESKFSQSGDGPWQFTKDTARRFGLHINSYVDERRDPVLSTRAAAEYLAELHDASGGDWPMTVIAWNNGDAAIDRYWSLRGPNFERFGNMLPSRTRGLLGRFMAVAYLARHASDYGLEPVTLNEMPSFQTLRVRGGTSLIKLAFDHGTTLGRLHDLNPALLRDIVPPNTKAYTIRVPANHQASAGAWSGSPLAGY
jgi:peptidoglycan lytic transglycosylase D